MQSISEVERLSQDVLAIPVLDEVSVAKLFGTVLKRADASGNPYIKIFQAALPKHPLVRSIELRVPSEQNDSGGAFLILTVRPLSKLTIADVQSAYGHPTRSEMPKAAAPMGTPTYDSYEYPWGNLTFGYLPAQQDRVSQIIFDLK